VLCGRRLVEAPDMSSLQRILSHCLAASVLVLAGCPPSPAPEPQVIVPQVEQVATWPPLVVDKVPGHFDLPWPVRPGGQTELWRIDLLDADRPELRAWLEAWSPAPGLLARRLEIGEGAAAAGRLALARRGAYIVRSRAPGAAHVALVLASRLRAALTLEDNDLEVLCADARTGQPVQGAFVKVIYRTERLSRERVLSASGTTNANGRWHSSLVRDRFAPSVVATAVLVHGDDYAIATARRTLDHSEADCRLTLRARRTSFRPGQQVDFSGVLQQRAGRCFAALGNTAVRLWLIGPTGAAVASARARTNAVGAFTGVFTLPGNAAPGSYCVMATVEGEARFEPRRFELFSVVPRRAAPFLLTLSLDRALVVPGETLELTLTARRADGNAVPNARVRLLSWGYPVGHDGAPAWARGTAPLDETRVEVLPAAFPSVAETDKGGRLVVRWQPSRAELPREDLLCAVHADVTVPELGSAQRTVEFLLLREPPGVTIAASARFVSPSEPIELTFTTQLPPPDRAATLAVCSLTYEDRRGRRRTYPLFSAPLKWLVEQRLITTATQPGRYTFSARAGTWTSQATVWVAEGERDIPWSGARAPALIAERPWVRRGETLRVVAAAPAHAAPVALTLRSGDAVERQTIRLPEGSRSLSFRAGPQHTGPLQAKLVQIHRGTIQRGEARIGIEPGGRVLQILARLLWVRHAKWSGRGYVVTTQDRLGKKVQSVVQLELVRPAFEGVPPIGVRRKTLHWHGGKATSEQGEIKVGFHQSLLASSYALLVEALAPDGRAGSRLIPMHGSGYAHDGKAAKPRSPHQKLLALAQDGLEAPIARWLATRLLARQPELARRLPKLITDAPTDGDASAIVSLASSYPSVATAALEAAIARGGLARSTALTIAADHAPDLRPTLERILASDASPTARAAAARALGRALPESLSSLARALESDADPLVRSAAASALGDGDADALVALAAAASREAHPDVRLVVVSSLRRLGGPTAAAALLGLATGKDPEAALVALRALADIGYRGTDPRLLGLIASGPPRLRSAAAEVLSSSGAPDAIAAVLSAGSRQPDGALVRALANFDSSRVKAAMVRWLAHDDPAVRLAAAEYLAARQDKRARPALRALLDPSVPSELANRAAKALIEQRDDVSAPQLIALLEAGRLTSERRRELVRAAGSFGWQQARRSLVAILWRGLAEPSRLRNAEERHLWVEALRAASVVGPIWDAVIESAAGPTAPESLYAPALSALRREGFPAFLRALWRSPLPDDLRREAVVAYARAQGGPAVRELVELLESPVLQGPASRALADLGVIEPLLVGLNHRSSRTRAAAAAALGAIGDIRAAPALQPLLKDTDFFVRLEAAHALAAITKQPVIYTDHLGEPRQATP